MATKNITLKIDAEVYRKARMIAAQQDSSVSRMVRGFLEGLHIRDEATEKDRQQQRTDLLAELWAISDSKPRAEEPATIRSRDEFYEGVMEDRGLRR